MRTPRYKKLNFMSIAATLTSLALVLSVCVAAYTLLAPVKVLQDWNITYDKPYYTAGDQAVILSSYTKLRNVSGQSIRYIECRTPQGYYARYELNKAVANRVAGMSGTGIIVTLPKHFVAVTLPTQCRFTINITYNINSLRSVNETNSSKLFTLYPVGGGPQTSSTKTQSSVVSPGGATTSNTTTETMVTNNTPAPASAPVTRTAPAAEPTPTPSYLDQVPLFGRIFKQFGL